MVLPETILDRALQIFRSEGIERHTEEDLIARLGVPEHEFKAMFPNKAEMVRKVMQYDLSSQEARDQERLQQAENPVEKVILLLQYGIQDLQSIHPAFIVDLQQHYPQVWQMGLDHLGSYSHDLNLSVINEGIVQGYFRKDINLQLVAKIVIEQFNMLINPHIFPPERFELGEVFRSVYLYYVRGLCTDKGSKLAEDYFSRNNI